jgi:hypothetical protein
MNPFIIKYAVIIVSITSIDLGLRALGFDFSKAFKGIRGYWDILSGISGALILISMFTNMQ